MRKNDLILFSILTMGVFLASGCATTRPRRPDPTTELSNQVTQLQTEVKAKDAQIQDLETRVEGYKQALEKAPQTPVAGTSVAEMKSSVVHVPGVSVEEVQRALTRAGFDPGAVDGRAGKKTKSAIKQFQRRNNLRTDGVVGEKTWARLK